MFFVFANSVSIQKQLLNIRLPKTGFDILLHFFCQMMEILDPREAGKYITKVAKHVTINDDGIDKAVNEALDRINDGRLKLDLKLYANLAVHPDSPTDANVDWVFMTSALNFSFWMMDNEPQYLVTYKGTQHNGYMSM